MRRLAVLASGKGSNLEAIQRAIADGRIAAEIALLLTNNPDGGAAALAKKMGIPAWARPHKDFPSRADFDSAMLAAMEAASIDAVILAGYMRLLSPHFIRAYAGKILNIHPSLLPAFSGGRGVGDTLDYGARFSGCTVHFVTEDMDAGPIIIQAALPIVPEEDAEALHRRIQLLEHRIYPQAVRWLVQDRLRVEGRHVRLLPGAEGEESAASPSGPEGCLINPSLEKGF